MSKFTLLFLLFPILLFSQKGKSIKAPIATSIRLLNDSIYFTKQLNKDSSNYQSIKIELTLTNLTDSTIFLPNPHSNYFNTSAQDSVTTIKLTHSIKKDIVAYQKNSHNNVNADYIIGIELIELKPGKQTTLTETIHFASTHKLYNVNMSNYLYNHPPTYLRSGKKSNPQYIYERLPNGIYKIEVNYDFRNINVTPSSILGKTIPEYIYKPLLVFDPIQIKITGDYKDGLIIKKKAD